MRYNIKKKLNSIQMTPIFLSQFRFFTFSAIKILYGFLLKYVDSVVAPGGGIGRRTVRPHTQPKKT